MMLNNSVCTPGLTGVVGMAINSPSIVSCVPPKRSVFLQNELLTILEE